MCRSVFYCCVFYLFVTVAELLPICLEAVLRSWSCRRWLVLELLPLVGVGAVAVGRSVSLLFTVGLGVDTIFVLELWLSFFSKLLSVGLVAVACWSWSWSCHRLVAVGPAVL